MMFNLNVIEFLLLFFAAYLVIMGIVLFSGNLLNKYISRKVEADYKIKLKKCNRL